MRRAGEHRIEQAPILGVLGAVEPERDRLPVAAEVLARLLDVVAAVDGEDVFHAQQRDGAVRIVQDRALRGALHVHRLRFRTLPRRGAGLVGERDPQLLELCGLLVERTLVDVGHGYPPRVGSAVRLLRCTAPCTQKGGPARAQRTVRKNSRTSATNRSGTCIAAKCPPWGCSVQWVML